MIFAKVRNCEVESNKCLEINPYAVKFKIIEKWVVLNKQCISTIITSSDKIDLDQTQQVI